MVSNSIAVNGQGAPIGHVDAPGDLVPTKPQWDVDDVWRVDGC